MSFITARKPNPASPGFFVSICCVDLLANR